MTDISTTPRKHLSPTARRDKKRTTMMSLRSPIKWNYESDIFLAMYYDSIGVKTIAACDFQCDERFINNRVKYLKKKDCWEILKECANKRQNLQMKHLNEILELNKPYEKVYSIKLQTNKKSSA
jgi:hypothetical protein